MYQCTFCELCILRSLNFGMELPKFNFVIFNFLQFSEFEKNAKIRCRRSNLVCIQIEQFYGDCYTFDSNDLNAVKRRPLVRAKRWLFVRSTNSSGVQWLKWFRDQLRVGL